jgi:hypothetical protein
MRDRNTDSGLGPFQIAFPLLAGLLSIIAAEVSTSGAEGVTVFVCFFLLMAVKGSLMAHNGRVEAEREGYNGYPGQAAQLN